MTIEECRRHHKVYSSSVINAPLQGTQIRWGREQTQARGSHGREQAGPAVPWHSAATGATGDAPATEEHQTTSTQHRHSTGLMASPRHSPLPLPQHQAVRDAIKPGSCTLQLYSCSFSRMQRSFFFFCLFRSGIFLINIQCSHQNKMGVKARLLPVGSALCLYLVCNLL